MPTTTIETRGIILVSTHLDEWVEAFLIDRKARGLSPGTLKFYRVKLRLFLAFCDSQIVSQIEQLTPALLREFFLYLENAGHTAGGRHACYRALKAFLRWWEDEVEPNGWRNPTQQATR